MLGKAAKMGVPIVVSRTSPTSLSIRLARAWNITVVGYARRDRLRVYSAPERLWGWTPTADRAIANECLGVSAGRLA
jgi:FdhD protein